ncbi:methyl-accepting chemotaxis protein [Castellaniella sp.]|uniref:methyl-accepting chemotaxis protein n=1 Tax=Castellaniella sp. TaxID=1955812 RepID=UPI002AFF6B19|nr:methyl-accepting chemotaxis protein [Castellaniella sp.]
MQNLRVSTRLIVGFGFILVLMLLMSGIGAWKILGIKSGSEFLQTRQAVNALISDWARQVEVNVNQAQAISLVPDEQAKSLFQHGMEASSTRAGQIQQELPQLLVQPQGQALLKEIGAARQAYLAGRGQAMEAQQAGDQAAATALFLTTLPQLAADYQSSIAKLAQFQTELSNDVFADNQQSMQTGLTVLAVATLLALILGPLMAWLIARGLVRQLGGEPAAAAAVAQRIANGDLSAVIVTRPGDHSSLLYAMRQMQDNLASVVADVRHGAQSVASASNQITAGNLDLSSRTEEQASSLAETAATMEELTATVRQNADNAVQANELASTASQAAAQGGAIVSELVETMREIDSRSNQVADIIGVIDTIAFQTNILALNAAVEAARAGQQGRGFAVVAAEVRALAQRSASAAREIKDLIETSAVSTHRGNTQAANAGQAMQKIMDSISRVNDIMGEISAASREQSSGIQEVNTAVMQMDDVTRQNASLVEESAAAAGSLNDQATTLAQLVTHFRLGDMLEMPTSGHGSAVRLIAGDQPMVRAA